MPSTKKVKVNAPVNKKITRAEEETEESTPSLALKKKVPTAFKVRQGLTKKK